MTITFNISLLRPLLLPALASLFVVSAAQAADKPEPPWHKTCAKQGDTLSCFVEQFALAQPKNVPVLRVGFDLQGGEGKARMVVTVPLGVLLAPGLQLTVDGSKPIALPFERCAASGCEATAVLDTAALAKFETGKTLTVRYAVTDKASADIPITLTGLADALASLSK